MIALGLFDGMSGGQIALTELGFPLTKYYSSEIDKFANQQIMLNFPNTVQLGSVTDVDVSQLEPIDLLLGGSPCFTTGTQVVCVNDIRPIEDVKVGDMVLTHTGCYSSVAKVGGAIKDTVTINAQGLLGTTTTSNHPYYTRTMRRVWDSEKKTSYRSFSHPYWKEAGKLEKDDFICLPIISDEINYLNLTAEECFILGRYIADGHTRRDFRDSENRPNDRYWQLILSVGDKKIPALRERVTINSFSCYKHGQGTHRVVFSNKRLVEIAEQHCGCGAENKHLSKTLLDLPTALLEELIEGYLSGDGFQFAENKFSCITISRNLVLTLGLAILKVYRVGFSCSTHHPPVTRELCGRIVNQKTQYSLRFSKHQTKQANYQIIGSECWFRFKSIEATGRSERVYNMEVRGDNSYTADGAIVHNCQSFSFAGKRKGMATKCDIEILDLDTYLGLKAAGFEFEGQSYLFWEYVRILQDIRKYNPGVKFLLENVKMGKKWERVLTEAIGCEGIHINSALVCAQNRRRIYWTNIEGIQQPADRGILLRDILEDEVDEKYYLSSMVLDRASRKIYSSPQINPDKTGTLNTKNNSGQMSIDSGTTFVKLDKQLNPKRDQFKAGCLTAGAHSGGNHSDMDLICVAMRGRNPENPSDRTTGAPTEQRLEPNTTGKTNCLTTVGKDNLIMGCDYRSDEGFRVRENGKSGTLAARARNDESCGQLAVVPPRIRRLTPTECCRLQTVPDWYKWKIKVAKYLTLEGDKAQCDPYAKRVNVTNQSLVKKLDSATSTILGFYEEVQPLFGDQPLIRKKNVEWGAARDLTKHPWALASCTINAGNDLGLSTYPSDNYLPPINVSFVIEESETPGRSVCAISTTKCGKSMEILFTRTQKEASLVGEGTSERQMVWRFIESLPPKKLEGNLSRESKLCTMLTLINLIITQATSSLLQSQSTRLCINSSIGWRGNLLELELLSIKTERIVPTSDTAVYKMLGNGWTIEVIKHILSYWWEGYLL